MVIFLSYAWFLGRCSIAEKKIDIKKGRGQSGHLPISLFYGNSKFVERVFYCVQIFMSDSMDIDISVALLPVALSSALMLVAKKYVLSAVSM